MSIDYPKSENDNITASLSVDLVNCVFRTVREQMEEFPLEFSTVEHNDNSQLKFFACEVHF